jgi:hypothetical protein
MHVALSFLIQFVLLILLFPLRRFYSFYFSVLYPHFPSVYPFYFSILQAQFFSSSSSSVPPPARICFAYLWHNGYQKLPEVLTAREPNSRVLCCVWARTRLMKDLYQIQFFVVNYPNIKRTRS